MRLCSFGSNGRAIPLAFVFTTSEESALEGSKTNMLQDVLEFVGKRCPNVRFTLSDKDVSEIAAFRMKMPTAKYQLSSSIRSQESACHPFFHRSNMDARNHSRKGRGRCSRGKRHGYGEANGRSQALMLSTHQAQWHQYNQP